ncbi:protein of unknown function [Paraburkholderia kururiensis]
MRAASPICSGENSSSGVISNCWMYVSMACIAAARSSRFFCARATMSRSSSASSDVIVKLACFCWSSEKRWNSWSVRSFAMSYEMRRAARQGCPARRGFGRGDILTGFDGVPGRGTERCAGEAADDRARRAERPDARPCAAR